MFDMNGLRCKVTFKSKNVNLKSRRFDLGGLKVQKICLKIRDLKGLKEQRNF